MPSHRFSPADEVWLTAAVCNPDAPLIDVPFFALLDVYGSYWFYPSWCAYPGDCAAGDYQTLAEVPSGLTELPVIPSFIWPETGAGAADGLHFYAALVDVEAGALIGDVGTWEFGYGV